MKILLLANPNSSHTLKWARALSLRKLEIGIFGLNSVNLMPYEKYPDIQLFGGGIDSQFCLTNSGSLKKLYYLTALPKLKGVLSVFKPDIIHSHFISSYGLLGMLSLFRPHVLSVWGSDIFYFPQYSSMHKLAVKICLKLADKILSTSNVMAKEIGKYTDKIVEITPFGVDLKEFTRKDFESPFPEGSIVVGTVKTLEPNYGLEFLVRAFCKVRRKHPLQPLKLLIVGGGSQIDYLRNLISELGLNDCALLTGAVPYDQIVKYHNILDIFVALSIQESFGVAIIEASACEKPVVVSNVGGLPEVVLHCETGIVVPSKGVDEAAEAIEKLVLDKNLRTSLGLAGRKRVAKLYDWNTNVDQMVQIYSSLRHFSSTPR